MLSEGLNGNTLKKEYIYYLKIYNKILFPKIHKIIAF